MSGRWESNPRPEHGFRGYRLLALWSKVANQFDRLDSNQAVTYSVAVDHCSLDS